MRAIYSYGIALLIVLALALWLGTGVLNRGGQGPGKGETAVAALVDGGNGPLTNAVEKSGINNGASHASEDDPAQTIAERNEAAGTGANQTPRSVRIQISTAQAMPITVPLRGNTQAKSQVSIVAQTAGTVQAVAVSKGQPVKAGDLLCTLDQGARKLAVDQAKAGVTQAQTALDANTQLVKKGLAAPNTTAALQAAVKTANTALENAQLELARTEIKSSVDGIVQAPLATVGSVLAMGTPCATVVQLDPMLFVASVPESKIAYAKLGLTADVTAITGDKAQGKVTFIADTADAATRSFPVEIEIANPDAKIRDGLSAEAVVNVGTSLVHVLPQSVMTLDDKGVLGVRTVEDGNKVAFHAITIVKDTRDGIWVVGLPTIAKVITVGQDFVQPGQVVDAQTDPTPIGATADKQAA